MLSIRFGCNRQGPQRSRIRFLHQGLYLTSRHSTSKKSSFTWCRLKQGSTSAQLSCPNRLREEVKNAGKTGTPTKEASIHFFPSGNFRGPNKCRTMRTTGCHSSLAHKTSNEQYGLNPWARELSSKQPISLYNSAPHEFMACPVHASCWELLAALHPCCPKTIRRHCGVSMRQALNMLPANSPE